MRGPRITAMQARVRWNRIRRQSQYRTPVTEQTSSYVGGEVIILTTGPGANPDPYGDLTSEQVREQLEKL